jgi:hypothetical protein
MWKHRGVAMALVALAAGALAEERALTARIYVRDTEGKPVRGAYVALVPPYRPWGRPLAETTAEDGTALFRVPPDHYRVEAGGVGFGPSVPGSLEVTPKGANELMVTLTALHRLHGTVRDAAGIGLAGARIAFAPALIPVGLWRYSAMGAKAFNEEATTTADDQGLWSLAVPGDGGIWLEVEKDGYARAWKALTVAETKDKSVDLILVRGAQLEVLADRLDPAMTLTLRRMEPPDAGGVPREWEPLVAAQPVITASTTWRSLPPGTYEVLTKYSDPSRFGGKAQRLGEIRLVAGDQKQLAVTLPPPPPVPAEVIQLFLPGVAEETISPAQTFGVGKKDALIRLRSASEAVIEGSLLFIEGLAAHAAFFAVTEERLITPPEATQEVAGPPRAVVHPRADVQLRVTPADPALLLPRGGVASYQECRAASLVQLPFEVGSDGTIRLPAPAGCKSAVFRLEAFEPVISTRLIRAGEKVVLGDFALRAAGSARVRVAQLAANAPVSNAVVTVSAPDVDGRTVPVASAVTAVDGWATLDGLPPHRELQVVARKAENVSPPLPLRVEPAARALIDPLSLPSPASLEIKPRFDAETKSRYPDAQVSEIRIEPAQEKGEPQSAEVGARESIRFDHLLAGTWNLLAVLRIAGGVYPLELQPVTLSAGEAQRIEPVLAPLVFSGTVTAHGSPVEAQVDIHGPRDQLASITRSVPAGKDGHFQVILPARGGYDITVRRMRSDRLVPLGEVAFAEPAAPLSLTFPDSALEVHVRSAGHALAAAAVTAILRRDAAGGLETLETVARTDADGVARFEALPAGLWTLSVNGAETRRAAEKTVAIREGEQSIATIDMTDGVAFSGTVRDVSGNPQRDAMVRCLLPRSGAPPQLVTARSGFDGRYTLDIASPAPTFARCGVVTLDGFVQAVQLAPGPNADVVLLPLSGTLHVVLPDKMSGSLWLSGGGGGLVDLSRWLSRSAGARTLELPALAEGNWKLIRILTLGDWIAAGEGRDPLPLGEATVKAGEVQSIRVESSN